MDEHYLKVASEKEDGGENTGKTQREEREKRSRCVEGGRDRSDGERKKKKKQGTVENWQTGLSNLVSKKKQPGKGKTFATAAKKGPTGKGPDHSPGRSRGGGKMETWGERGGKIHIRPWFTKEQEKGGKCEKSATGCKPKERKKRREKTTRNINSM